MNKFNKDQNMINHEHQNNEYIIELVKPPAIFEKKQFKLLLNKIKTQDYYEKFYHKCMQDQSINGEIVKNYAKNFRNRKRITLETEIREPKIKSIMIQPQKLSPRRSASRLKLKKEIESIFKHTWNIVPAPSLIHQNHHIETEIDNNNVNESSISQNEKQIIVTTDIDDNLNKSPRNYSVYDDVNSTNNQSVLDRSLSTRRSYVRNSKSTPRKLNNNHSSKDHRYFLDSHSSKRSSINGKLNTMMQYISIIKDQNPTLKSRKPLAIGNLSYKVDMNDPNLITLFKKISGQEKSGIKAVRFSKDLLRNFYGKQFPSLIADKLMTILEFPNIIDFKTYVQIFENLINKNLYGVYYLAFKIFDFNNDGYICHRDLFQIFKFAEDFPFLRPDFHVLHSVSKIFHMQNILKEILKYRASTSTDLNIELSGLNYSHKRSATVKNEKSNLSISPENFKKIHIYTSSTTDPLQHTKRSSISQKKERISLSKIWSGKDYGLPILSKLHSENDLAKKYQNLFEFSTERFKILNQEKTKLPSLNNGNRAINTSNLLTEGNDDRIRTIQRYSHQRSRSIKTNDTLNFMATWQNFNADFTNFREMFVDDLPHIIYEIIYRSLLLNFSHEPLIMTPVGIFQLFEGS